MWFFKVVCGLVGWNRDWFECRGVEFIGVEFVESVSSIFVGF